MISKVFRELLTKTQAQIVKTDALKFAFDKARQEYDEANKERMKLEGEIQKYLNQEFIGRTHVILPVGEETWMLTHSLQRFDTIVRKVQMEK